MVKSVEVHEGQRVAAGDVLFRLDPEPFEIALANAKATELQAEMTVGALKADYRKAIQQTSAQQAMVDVAKTTLDRYAALVKQGSIAQTQWDQQQATYLSALATLNSLDQAAAATLARLNGNPELPVDSFPDVMKARAAVAEAQRQLDHTVVRAPFDGIVTAVSSLQPGTLIISAMSAFSTTSAVGLVSDRNMWIDAHMKETDLTRVHAGQTVDVKIDTYPDCSWRGSVGFGFAGQRRRVLAVAVREHFRQLGEGRAAHSGADQSRRQLLRRAAEHRHERGHLDRHRPSAAGKSSAPADARRWTRRSPRRGPLYSSTTARNLAVACAMAAMFMQTLDQTIANVALPHMQGSLSASRDQITWVLTSYIIASAIMTAPVGWIASRFGKRRFILVAVAGFTITSALCGLAQNLDQIIVFRLLQGAFGAALGPLSQTIMMDMFPPQSRGSVMGIWGMGVMLGPILGPTLGGYLTDAFSWRWVFYINVPVGIAAVDRLVAVLSRSGPRSVAGVRLVRLQSARAGPRRAAADARPRHRTTIGSTRPRS